MGKILDLPEWLSASIVASASDVGTVTDNGNGTVTVTNVHVGTVKNVLGESTYNVSALCKSPNINMWAYWSPVSLGYDSVNQVFTKNYPTTEFKLGDFAAYNHGAAGPAVSSQDATIYTSTLSGYVNVSSTVNLGEIDWTKRYISPNWFNYVWVVAENVVNGVTHTIRASTAISSTNGSAYATALNVPYNVPTRGYDNITVRTYLGNSADPLVKLSDRSGSFTWTYKLQDQNVYFGAPIFETSSASGSGYNSAYNYFVVRGAESIDLQGNFSLEMDINERDYDSVQGKTCTSNDIYISYTDNNNIAREQLVKSNLAMYAGDPKSGFTGKLTYPPKSGSTATAIVRNAVLS